MRVYRFLCVGTRNDHVKTTQKPRASGRKKILRIKQLVV